MTSTETKRVGFVVEPAVDGGFVLHTPGPGNAKP